MVKKKQSFLACYQQWRDAHTRMLVGEDGRIIRDLINLAPEDLHLFLGCHCDFERVLQHRAGVVFTFDFSGESGTIHFYGFKDIKHFKQQMRALQRAWSDVVKVEVEVEVENLTECLKLHFSIVS